jgi:hypothetical protein
MDSNYTYTYDTPTAAGLDAAMLSGIVAFLILFALLSYAITAFLLGKVFQKAGVPQWAAWVPVYNNWKLLELGGQQGFWAILAFIPFVNIISLIFLYIAMYHIGRTLNKEGWFVIVAIFLPLIWLIWLGYDDSKWPKHKTAHVEQPVFKKKPVTRKKKAA